MRKPTLLALATMGVLAGGIASWAPDAAAQPAPPPAPAGSMPPPDGAMDLGATGRDAMERGRMEHGAMDHGPMERGGPSQRMEMERQGSWMQRMRQFALVYPARDRALSGPDVQKIAEAFLLINGNHTWKIINVTEEPERVLFAVATPDGTAIAQFAMDRHTGRPQRLS